MVHFSAVPEPISNPSEWLKLSFEQQSRMQHLDEQFRAGVDGSDQGFEWRNTLKAEVNKEKFSITAGPGYKSFCYTKEEGITPLSVSFCKYQK